MYELSAAMNSAVQKVLARPICTEFVIDLKVICSTDTSFSFKPLFLDKMTIIQDPPTNYADKITVYFECSPTEYMAMYNRHQELRAILVTKYVDAQTEQYVFDPEPTVKRYVAIIKDAQDLYKKYATGQLQATERSPRSEQHQAARVPVALDLVEESVYNLRHLRFTSIYQETTMKDLLLHIARSVKELGVREVHLIPPDNVLAYNHVTIPSLDFSSIILFLQQRYGVYLKGVDFYVSEGVLYIYPPYENRPKHPQVINVYNVASNRFAGLKSYHQYTDARTLNIVAAGGTSTRNIAEEAAENVGTGVTFTRSSQLVDNYVTMTKNGPVISQNNTVAIANKTNRSMRVNANNSIHSQTTDNIFLAASKLAQWDAVLVAFAWPQAVPMSMLPGAHIQYHYDENNIFVTRHGILESVSYEILPKTRTGLGTVYNCSATVQFRIEPDEKKA